MAKILVGLIFCLSLLLASVAHGARPLPDSMPTFDVAQAPAAAFCADRAEIAQIGTHKACLHTSHGSQGGQRCKVDIAPLAQTDGLPATQANCSYAAIETDLPPGVASAPPHGPPRTVQIV